MKNLAVLFGYFLLFNFALSGVSSANSSIDCFDCGKGGWQKMNLRCSIKVLSKQDFMACLKNFSWSGITKEDNSSVKKVVSGYLEIGGSDLLSKPNKKSISVFRFNNWACDQDGNLYLNGQLG